MSFNTSRSRNQDSAHLQILPPVWELKFRSARSRFFSGSQSGSSRSSSHSTVLSVSFSLIITPYSYRVLFNVSFICGSAAPPTSSAQQNSSSSSSQDHQEAGVHRFGNRSMNKDQTAPAETPWIPRKSNICFFFFFFLFFYSIWPKHSWLPAAGLDHMNTSPQPPACPPL